MNKHRGYLALVLLWLASVAVPSSAEAGPLLDWLFYRNRSQGLAASQPVPPGANNTYAYNANRVQTNRPAIGYNGRPRTSCLSGLFGGNRYNQQANANLQRPNVGANGATANYGSNYAANNVNRTTAGYAPQGGCSTGWCQQTVVRWIPQTAYRTAYQPVPVTTYKTSTTINPANGLPRTCTRPCTSYSYQARRVPYTTYRPIYTTVPVADTLGGQPNANQYAATQRPPAANGAPAYDPRNYAFQPPTQPTNSSGCAGCQNGSVGLPPTPVPYGNWSNVPGYGTSDRPVDPRSTPWQTTDSYANAGNGPRATPWQTPPRGEVPPAASGYGPTDWQTLPPSGSTQPPTRDEVPADRAPRLRPEYSDQYGNYDRAQYEMQRPAERSPQRVQRRSEIQFVPRSDRPQIESSYRAPLQQPDAYAYNNEPYQQPPMRQEAFDQGNMFVTPRDARPPANRRPRQQQNIELAPPSNNEVQPQQGRSSEGFRGGIPAQPRTWPNPNDKTATSESPTVRASPSGESRTRYAATPIRWQNFDPYDQPGATGGNRPWSSR